MVHTARKSLHQQAAELSGVSEAQAAALDSLRPSAFERLGEEAVRSLCSGFYSRVFADTIPLPSGTLLRAAFASVTREHATERLTLFLVERLGGPRGFSESRGSLALLARHAPYAAVTAEAGGRWVEHMEAALAEATADGELCSALRHYFRFTASYVVEGRLLCNSHNNVGYS